LHLTGERRPRPAGAGDAVVAPCGGDCVALLGPLTHGPCLSAAAAGRAASWAVRPRTEQRNAVAPAGGDHRVAGTGGARPSLAREVQALWVPILTSTPKIGEEPFFVQTRMPAPRAGAGG